MKRHLYTAITVAGALLGTLTWADPAPRQDPPPTDAGRKEAAAVAPKPTVDRLDLDATEVTGTKELPKVMVIVPWKHNQAGNVAGRPASSLMDEVLQPLDRDVFQREMAYYEKLPPIEAPPATQPEN